MQNRTPYQERIIKRYYENRDDIMADKLATLVTDLYFAKGKKRQQLWKRIAIALANLNVSQTQIDFLTSEDKPELLAKFLERKK
ncbi:MAG: hypothetical protein LBH59_01450 [Planctomycetaceae bacterium]|jgi:hypothetical protein|nr:hypothetical protein [Planctomycetaceae bacterium]